MSIRKKDYIISILLVLAILSAFWLLRVYIIPVPESTFAFTITIALRPFVFCVVIGIVADVVFLQVKKPIFLAVIAVIAGFTCLLCTGSLFTDLYALAVLCFGGSVPYIASLIVKMEQKHKI